MSHEKLETARQRYKRGEIDFIELDRAFFNHATDSEIMEFWNAPVYDRPGVIKGLSQSERDQEWNNLIN